MQVTTQVWGWTFSQGDIVRFHQIFNSLPVVVQPVWLLETAATARADHCENGASWADSTRNRENQGYCRNQCLSRVWSVKMKVVSIDEVCYELVYSFRRHDHKSQSQSKSNRGLISNNWYNFKLYPWVITKIGQTGQSGDTYSSKSRLSKSI